MADDKHATNSDQENDSENDDANDTDGTDIISIDNEEQRQEDENSLNSGDENDRIDNRMKKKPYILSPGCSKSFYTLDNKDLFYKEIITVQSKKNESSSFEESANEHLNQINRNGLINANQKTPVYSIAMRGSNLGRTYYISEQAMSSCSILQQCYDEETQSITIPDTLYFSHPEFPTFLLTIVHTPDLFYTQLIHLHHSADTLLIRQRFLELWGDIQLYCMDSAFVLSELTDFFWAFTKRYYTPQKRGKRGKHTNIKNNTTSEDTDNIKPNHAWLWTVLNEGVLVKMMPYTNLFMLAEQDYPSDFLSELGRSILRHHDGLPLLLFTVCRKSKHYHNRSVTVWFIFQDLFGVNTRLEHCFNRLSFLLPRQQRDTDSCSANYGVAECSAYKGNPRNPFVQLKLRLRFIKGERDEMTGLTSYYNPTNVAEQLVYGYYLPWNEFNQASETFQSIKSRRVFDEHNHDVCQVFLNNSLLPSFLDRLRDSISFYYNLNYDKREEEKKEDIYLHIEANHSILYKESMTLNKNPKLPCPSLHTIQNITVAVEKLNHLLAQHPHLHITVHFSLNAIVYQLLKTLTYNESIYLQNNKLKKWYTFLSHDPELLNTMTMMDFRQPLGRVPVRYIYMPKQEWDDRFLAISSKLPTNEMISYLSVFIPAQDSRIRYKDNDKNKQYHRLEFA